MACGVDEHRRTKAATVSGTSVTQLLSVPSGPRAAAIRRSSVAAWLAARTVPVGETSRIGSVEIEGVATAWAAQVISAEDLDHLAGLIEQMDLAKAQHDRSKYVPANRDFHFTIYRAAGSDALMSIIESLWLQIGPYFNLLKATGNWWTANVEHKALRDALVRKDGDAARRALQADIEGAAAALQSVLVAQKQAAEELKPRQKRKMP
jgi:DNA-binding FadR family transcriptional regulator